MFKWVQEGKGEEHIYHMEINAVKNTGIYVYKVLSS